MKNAIRTIKSIIRANPRLARIAITADITIGLAFCAVLYLILNVADISVGMTAALTVNFILFTAGVALLAYNLIVIGVADTFLSEDTVDLGDISEWDDITTTDYDVDMDLEREDFETNFDRDA